MDAKVLILGTYVLAVLVIGFIARRKAASTPTDYYLAGRKLSPLILLATMAATNFSAFTIFGCSGEGYRAGLSFLPIMAFGTGFMALTFWLIGRKAWQLSKQHGLVTPVELVGKIYNNRWLDNVFIERVWRSLKYEEVYLKAYETVAEAREGIGTWIEYYNTQRRHQALGRRTPNDVYDRHLFPRGYQAA